MGTVECVGKGECVGTVLGCVGTVLGCGYNPRFVRTVECVSRVVCG